MLIRISASDIRQKHRYSNTPHENQSIFFVDFNKFAMVAFNLAKSQIRTLYNAVLSTFYLSKEQQLWAMKNKIRRNTIHYRIIMVMQYDTHVNRLQYYTQFKLFSYWMQNANQHILSTSIRIFPFRRTNFPLKE